MLKSNRPLLFVATAVALLLNLNTGCSNRSSLPNGAAVDQIDESHKKPAVKITPFTTDDVYQPPRPYNVKEGERVLLDSARMAHVEHRTRMWHKFTQAGADVWGHVSHVLSVLEKFDGTQPELLDPYYGHYRYKHTSSPERYQKTAYLLAIDFARALKQGDGLWFMRKLYVCPKTTYDEGTGAQQVIAQIRRDHARELYPGIEDPVLNNQWIAHQGWSRRKNPPHAWPLAIRQEMQEREAAREAMEPELPEHPTKKEMMEYSLYYSETIPFFLDSDLFYDVQLKVLCSIELSRKTKRQFVGMIQYNAGHTAWWPLQNYVLRQAAWNCLQNR